MASDVRFQQCLDENGNHLGWLKLVEMSMTAEEFAREMEYLVNHPYYNSDQFLEDSKGHEGPPREYRGRVDVNQWRKQQEDQP